MTYRITTSDGTAVIVDQADLDLITAYLVLRGYPPVSVQLNDSVSSEIDYRLSDKGVTI